MTIHIYEFHYQGISYRINIWPNKRTQENCVQCLSCCFKCKTDPENGQVWMNILYKSHLLYILSIFWSRWMLITFVSLSFFHATSVNKRMKPATILYTLFFIILTIQMYAHLIIDICKLVVKSTTIKTHPSEMNYNVFYNVSLAHCVTAKKYLVLLLVNSWWNISYNMWPSTSKGTSCRQGSFWDNEQNSV